MARRRKKKHNLNDNSNSNSNFTSNSSSHIDWDESYSRKETWKCPGCEGTCPCQRCVKLGPRMRSTKVNSIHPLLLRIAEAEDEFDDWDKVVPSTFDRSSHSQNGSGTSKRRRLSEQGNYSKSNSGSEEEFESEEEGSFSTPNDNDSESLKRTRHQNRNRLSSQEEEESPDNSSCVKSEESEKPKPVRIQDAVQSYFDELVQRERRCESTIKEMERILSLMKREKQEILIAKQKTFLYLQEATTTAQ